MQDDQQKQLKDMKENIGYYQKKAQELEVRCKERYNTYMCTLYGINVYRHVISIESISPISSQEYPPSTSLLFYYFGGARSKGFATLRNVSKLQFFDKIGQAKFVGFRFYSAI